MSCCVSGLVWSWICDVIIALSVLQLCIKLSIYVNWCAINNQKKVTEFYPYFAPYHPSATGGSVYSLVQVADGIFTNVSRNLHVNIPLQTHSTVNNAVLGLVQDPNNKMTN